MCIRKCVKVGLRGTRPDTLYKNMKNQAKKVVTKAMKEAAERKLIELNELPNKVFKLVKSMKKDGKDIEGGRCMRGSNGSEFQ